MKVDFGGLLKRINVRRTAKYALYMLVALICQTMLFSKFRLLGVCPMALPAVAVAVGMFEGATWGAVFGVIMGMFADMAFIENTVIFTILFPALAFASGFVSQFFINRRFFAFMGAAAVSLLVTAFAQMLGTFAVDGWSGALLQTAFLQAFWSLPPAALAYLPPARWIKD